MVRQRSKTGQGKTKRCLSRKDSTGSLVENPAGKDEGMVEITVRIPVHVFAQVPGFGLPVVAFFTTNYVWSKGEIVSVESVSDVQTARLFGLVFL